MVTKQASRSGLTDWLIQRCTAIITGVYVIFLVAYILSHTSLSYQTWEALFATIWMKLATILVLLSILWHAWIGLWTVFTDYVKNKTVRLLLELVVILLLLAYLVWVLEILWP